MSRPLARPRGSFSIYHLGWLPPAHPSTRTRVGAIVIRPASCPIGSRRRPSRSLDAPNGGRGVGSSGPSIGATGNRNLRGVRGVGLLRRLGARIRTPADRPRPRARYPLGADPSRDRPRPYGSARATDGPAAFAPSGGLFFGRNLEAPSVVGANYEGARRENIREVVAGPGGPRHRELDRAPSRPELLLRLRCPERTVRRGRRHRTRGWQGRPPDVPARGGERRPSDQAGTPTSRSMCQRDPRNGIRS